MQDMILGESDRTEDLMGDSSAFGSSFEKSRFINIAALTNCTGGRARHGERSCRFPSEPREVVLDCLEFPNWSFEGHPLVGIRDTQRQNRLKCAGSLYAAAHRPHQHQGCM